MNYSKVKGLLLAGFAFFALNLSAQTTDVKVKEHPHKEHRTQKSPEAKAQKMTDRMTEKLNLNEKQKSEVYTLLLDNAKEQAEIRRRMKEKNRNQINAELKGILSPEQFDSMLEMQKKRQQKRAERRKTGGR